MWPIKANYLKWLARQVDTMDTRCVQMGEIYGAHLADYEMAKLLENTEAMEYHKEMSDMYFKRMQWYARKYVDNLLIL